jgi:hypothetical protein
METTFYFISFYYSKSRELFPIETRKMVCYSDNELSILKAECRKYCRQIFRNGFGRKPSDVTYRLSTVSERQYDESIYSLL